MSTKTLSAFIFISYCLIANTTLLHSPIKRTILLSSQEVKAEPTLEGTQDQLKQLSCDVSFLNPEGKACFTNKITADAPKLEIEQIEATCEGGVDSVHGSGNLCDKCQVQLYEQQDFEGDNLGFKMPVKGPLDLENFILFNDGEPKGYWNSALGSYQIFCEVTVTENSESSDAE